MAQILKGTVGELLQGDGPGPDSGFRQGKTGEMIVSELHGRYYETTLRGRNFSAANQAAQAVSVALATTYTGILLYNPPNSGFNLVPNKVKFALSAAPAAIASIMLLNGFSATGGVTAQTTALSPTQNLIGGPKGVGIALSAATILTPTWLFPLYDGFTASALPAPTLPVDLEGNFIIPPGGFIGIGALTAVTGFGGISWEEVPIR